MRNLLIMSGVQRMRVVVEVIGFICLYIFTDLSTIPIVEEENVQNVERGDTVKAVLWKIFPIFAVLYFFFF